MNIENTKNLIKKIIGSTDTVPALVGVKGIGKTESIKQVANELGIGYQAIYPSSLQGEDFMGLLIKDLETKTTQYLAPDFFPTQNAIDKGMFQQKGILVLEELNRADTQTISALFPLLLEKKINGHELADGWHIVVSMNPDSFEYTTNSIDNAGMDRILPINVEADLEEYSSYMITNKKAHRDVMYYLAYNTDMLCKDEDSDDKTPSPRGWTKACEIMNKCDLNNEELLVVLEGLVGYAAASSFVGFLKDKDIQYPNAKKILHNFNEEEQKVVKNIADLGRYDIINMTVKEMCADFNPVILETDGATTYKADEETNKRAVNINKFLSLVPKEITPYFYKIIITELNKGPLKNEDQKKKAILNLMFKDTADTMFKIIREDQELHQKNA